MSPIIGLTDDITPRFPRLGRLRKGGEKVKGGYGPDLDHWRFTSEDPELVQVFKDTYGLEPKSIPVYIPYETVDEAFPTWAELWSASGLQHRCDGQNMTVWLEAGKYQHGSKPCPGGHKDGDPKNDAVGRLAVILPGLIQAGYVGYVTLETHSKNDIIGIMAVLQAAYNAKRDLRGILFNLRRVQESITTPGFGDRKGARSRTNKWLVRLEPAVEWAQAQLRLAAAAAAEQFPGPPLVENPNGGGVPVEVHAFLNALHEKTPKGAEFHTLTIDQLKLLVEKGSVAQKKAAALLLEEPSTVIWEAWDALGEMANQAHIEPVEVPEQPCNLELGKLYLDLGERLDARINGQDENG